MVNKENFYETYQLFDKSIIVEIIDIFLNEYEERFVKLEQNVAEKDFQNMRFNAHSLKGVVANFSAPVPLEMARAFEKTSANLLEANGAGYDDAKMKMDLQALKEATYQMARQLAEIKDELLAS